MMAEAPPPSAPTRAAVARCPHPAELSKWVFGNHMIFERFPAAQKAPSGQGTYASHWQIHPRQHGSPRLPELRFLKGDKITWRGF